MCAEAFQDGTSAIQIRTGRLREKLALSGATLWPPGIVGLSEDMVTLASHHTLRLQQLLLRPVSTAAGACSSITPALDGRPLAEPRGDAIDPGLPCSLLTSAKLQLPDVVVCAWGPSCSGGLGGKIS